MDEFVSFGLWLFEDDHEWGEPYPSCPNRAEMIAILSSSAFAIVYLSGLLLWTL